MSIEEAKFVIKHNNIRFHQLHILLILLEDKILLDLQLGFLTLREGNIEARGSFLKMQAKLQREKACFVESKNNGTWLQLGFDLSIGKTRTHFSSSTFSFFA